MARTYESGDSIESVANGLIPQYHPELTSARMEYIFVDKASKKSGKEVLGVAKKVGGVHEFLLEKDFLFVIALDKWNELNEGQRLALVDHLLERCTGEEDEATGEMSWKCREPDVQEFASILERRGVWHPDLVAFVTVAQQIEIEDIAEEETESVTESEDESVTVNVADADDDDDDDDDDDLFDVDGE